MMIQQYLSSIDGNRANGQVCECETNYWINFNFTSKVVTLVERHTSQGEGHSSYYTKILKSVMTDAFLYVTSRRKSTTLHLDSLVSPLWTTCQH